MKRLKNWSVVMISVAIITAVYSCKEETDDPEPAAKTTYNGAAKAILNGKSLLPAGIIKVNGKFRKGDNVLIMDENQNNLARGLSSFSSEEINKIKGLQSNQILDVLGYSSKSEIVHKDDMVKL